MFKSFRCVVRRERENVFIQVVSVTFIIHRAVDSTVSSRLFSSVKEYLSFIYGLGLEDICGVMGNG